MIRASISTLLLLLLPLPAAAQDAPTDLRGWSYEVGASMRWLHGREKPRFAPFTPTGGSLVIDSAGTAGPEWSFDLRVDVPVGRETRIRLGVAPLGGTAEVEVSEVHRPRPGFVTVEDSIRFARESLAGDEGGLRLPESRAWMLLPVLRPPRLEPGARWTDTLDLAAERDGYAQSLRGPRVREVVSDTVVNGHRLWVVRDSARVRYRERWLDPERTLDTVAVVERTVEGVIRGRALFDPALPVARARWDTTALSGQAVLRYPDGRAFATPARLERTRRWTLYDPAAREARRAAFQAEFRANDTGMVGVRTGEVARRLGRGDQAFRDSMIAAWLTQTDPGQWSRAFHQLSTLSPHAEGIGDRLRDLALEAGDTALVVRQALRSYPTPRDPLTSAELSLLLPFLNDPGLALAFGLERDRLYGSIRQGLLVNPPALEPDTATWPCTPAACRRLAAQWDRAEEPRLRDLGLIAHLSMDPARWGDAVLARAREGSALVEPAALLVRGVGATWDAAARLPPPPPDADWRAWLQWMDGRKPEFRAEIDAVIGPPRPRFLQSHEAALQFHAAHTGRDVVGEIQRRLEEAPGDTARLVYRAILMGLGAYQADPGAAADSLASGSPTARRWALGEMLHLFESARPADPAVAAELMDRLLAVVVEGAEPWPALVPPDGPAQEFSARGMAERHDSVFVLADGLPPAVRERWAGRVQLVSARDRRDRWDPAIGLHISPSTVQQVGPFARLGFDYVAYRRQEGKRYPQGDAAGHTVYLLRTESGWRLVYTSSWVA